MVILRGSETMEDATVADFGESGGKSPQPEGPMNFLSTVRLPGGHILPVDNEQIAPSLKLQIPADGCRVRGFGPVGKDGAPIEVPGEKIDAQEHPGSAGVHRFSIPVEKGAITMPLEAPIFLSVGSGGIDETTG